MRARQEICVRRRWDFDHAHASSSSLDSLSFRRTGRQVSLGGVVGVAEHAAEEGAHSFLRTAPNEPVATIRSRTHQPAYRDPSTQQMAAFTFRCVPFTLMAVWDTGLRTPQVVSTAGRSGLRAPSIVTAQLPRASLSARGSLFL
jgi:hypothetical protein